MIVSNWTNASIPITIFLILLILNFCAYLIQTSESFEIKIHSISETSKLNREVVIVHSP